MAPCGAGPGWCTLRSSAQKRHRTCRARGSAIAPLIFVGIWVATCHGRRSRSGWSCSSSGIPCPADHRAPSRHRAAARCSPIGRPGAGLRRQAARGAQLQRRSALVTRARSASLRASPSRAGIRWPPTRARRSRRRARLTAPREPRHLPDPARGDPRVLLLPPSANTPRRCGIRLSVTSLQACIPDPTGAGRDIRPT